jgi:hypothetical protein
VMARLCQVITDTLPALTQVRPSLIASAPRLSRVCSFCDFSGCERQRRGIVNAESYGIVILAADGPCQAKSVRPSPVGWTS